ncbi:hypothetical protein [Actinocorallia longicatena]|uniref:Small secreted domain DUF320 n=1 Tax=Actinocorallia longicatena TaxID=111803 RepID=A0ABP6QGD9_9ACTN
MIKRMIAMTVLAAGAGAGALAFSAPAMAGDDPTTVQVIGGQTCRGLDIVGVGAAIHNVLGVTHEQGHCVNGSTVVDD